MSDTIDTKIINGFTVRIVADDDRFTTDPREYDNLGLFLSFPSDYSAPDGIYAFPDDFPDDDGNNTWDAFVAGIKHDFGSTVVLAVRRDEHGPNCRYYVTAPDDGERWDRGLFGVICDTSANRRLLGCDNLSADEITASLTSEVEEYSKWANGEVYGIVVTDRNGDDVNSCWGFIGLDHAEQSMSDLVPDEQPPRLTTLRLTDDQINALWP